MKVGIDAKLKNGILWDAALKLGSQAALAKYLDVPQTELGLWINFKKCPDFENPNFTARYAEIDAKLLVLTGHGLEDIFPPELRNKAFLNRTKRIQRTVEIAPQQLLAATGNAKALLPPPETLLFEQERSATIDEAVRTLPKEQQQVIRMRFGLSPYTREHLLDEVASVIGRSRERARQIEAKALIKLRHPTRSRKLAAVNS